MSTIRPARRRPSKDLIYQLLTAAVVGAILIAMTTYTVRKHLWAQQTIADIEPRYERLLGILQSEQDMQQTFARSQQLLQAYTYPANVDASQIGPDTQQTLRSAFANRNMTIVSSQVLEEQEADSLTAIPIEVQMQGNLLGLRDGLMALSSSRPLVQVDSIRVTYQGKNSEHDPVLLTIRAKFLVWRQSA